jgi:hypothetical protein
MVSVHLSLTWGLKLTNPQVQRMKLIDTPTEEDLLSG